MKPSNNNHFFEKVSVFQDRRLPEQANLAGYSAIINYYDLKIPLPNNLCAISDKHKVYEESNWKIYSPRYMPNNDLEGHLIFALKYEGVDLLVLKFLFKTIDKNEIEKIILAKPNSSYLRRIWFFYEWLMEIKLDIPDLEQGNYVDAIDKDKQFFGLLYSLENRYRINNNLLNLKHMKRSGFCPLVSKTDNLLTFQKKNLSEKLKNIINTTNVSILDRAHSHLLLKDTKSSYEIEKEKPPKDKLERWAYIASQAGKNELDKDELLRLQNIVIKDTRFTEMGIRQKEAFVGEHSAYNEPKPDHICAKSQDLESLIDDFIDFCSAPNFHQKLINDGEENKDKVLNSVIITAITSFGFVFIHPFADGNGRMHRYIIHHMLAKLNYTPENIIFPISSIILKNIDKYREVLESYSKPLLKYIEWEPDENGNIKILNDTIDYYRYFDATKMAEFLYECIEITIEEELPKQIKFLENYDRFKNAINNEFDMPDRMIEKLHMFLKQENGRLSKRALKKEFSLLEEHEIKEIEEIYNEIFD